MRQFRVYTRPETGMISAINDAHGASIACFGHPYRKGDIAVRQVGKTSCPENERQPSKFRIMREVSEAYASLLAMQAGDGRELESGWWYEVIGD